MAAFIKDVSFHQRLQSGDDVTNAATSYKMVFMFRYQNDSDVQMEAAAQFPLIKANGTGDFVASGVPYRTGTVARKGEPVRGTTIWQNKRVALWLLGFPVVQQHGHGDADAAGRVWTGCGW
jgi:hypothetical protein